MNTIAPTTPPFINPVAEPQLDLQLVKRDTDKQEPKEPALEDLPQGVLALLMQIQPMHPDTKLKLAMGASGLAKPVPGLNGDYGAAKAPAQAPRFYSLAGEQQRTDSGKRMVSAVMDGGIIAAGKTALAAQSDKPAVYQPVEKGGVPPVAVAAAPANIMGVTPVPNETAAVTPMPNETATVTQNARAVRDEPERDIRAQPTALLPISDKSAAPVERAPVTLTRQPNAMPEPMPLKLDLSTHNGTATSYLQVPFSKGQSVGQVTVTKAEGETGQTLLLSASSSDITTHLRDGLGALSEPTWRLVDEDFEHERNQDGQAQEEDDADADALLSSLLDRRERRT